MYGRGAWTETLATSAVPMIAASGVHLLRRRDWWATLAFAASTAILCGTHNISLVWGSAFLAAVVLVVVWAVRPAVRPSAVGRVLVLAALSGGTTLAFLLPNIAFSGRTVATLGTREFYPVPGSWFEDVLVPRFVPFSGVPDASTSPDLYLQLPVLVPAWLVAFGLVAVRRGVGSPEARRCFVGLSAVSAVLIVLLVWRSPGATSRSS
ncbi:MAG TPA: hypothetical protein VHF47_01885 [Acidimicrobiales bacterium]|nr:hypothetical protein [Acidimicrobiales bacterium]